MKQKTWEMSLSSLKKSENQVEKFLKGLTRTPGFANLPKMVLQDLKLAAMEALSNSFQYGQVSKQKPVKLRLSASPKKIEMQVHDYGRGFDLAKAIRKPPSDLATGGRGLLIMKNLMDQISFKKGKPNRLTLVKKLTRPKSVDSAMELYNRLQDSLQSLRPVEFLYEQFVDFVMGLFNVERASFLVFDPEVGALDLATSRGIPRRLARKISIKPGEGVAGYVFETGRPLLVNNLARIKKRGLKPRQKGYASSSFLSVPVIATPLHIGEETLGVLNLTDRRDGSRFTRQDLKLLNLMATQAASIFRIRQLIDAVKKHERFNRELQIVSEIQDRLIPNKFPKLPGLQIGGLCRLSPLGGGDYFDVFRMDRSLRGVIADVSGHNVGSAITMASFRSMVRSLSYDPNTPGQLLQALRWAMHEELIQLSQFISCWVWEYSGRGKLILSGAGHPPVMIYRAARKKWESVQAHHLPLGLEDESRVQNVTVKLAKKDWVIFHTDGLFDPRLREMGLDREIILQFLEKNIRKTPQKLVDQLFDWLRPHLSLLPAPDDVAVLALKLA